MLHYELPDIEQPGQVLRSSVILDGFNHLGETMTFKLSVCHWLSVIVSSEVGSVSCLVVGGGVKRSVRFSEIEMLD